MTAPTAGEGVAAPLLQLRGIGKVFFGNSVLRGIDLDVRPGEVHALVGRTAPASPRS